MMSDSGKVKYEVGDGIIAQRSSWRFDGTVADRFDRHISKSIPAYNEGHRLVVDYAKTCLSSSSITYELGCSTGVLTEKLGASSNPERSKIIGIDQVEGMLEIARKRCAAYDHVAFIEADILNFPFQPASLMVSYYTIQFIPPKQRKRVVQHIFNNLVKGGLFILFEKIYFSDPEVNRKINEQYDAYKRAQGYSDEEIKSKAASLENILIPQTQSENIDMLMRVGFNQVKIIFSELCWQGYAMRK